MLGVEKTFSTPGEPGVGDLVEFSITVKNAGNVDLVDVALTDAMFKNTEGEIWRNRCVQHRSKTCCAV